MVEHVKRRFVNTMVRKVNQMEMNQIILREVFKKYLEINDLDRNMVLDKES